MIDSSEYLSDNLLTHPDQVTSRDMLIKSNHSIEPIEKSATKFASIYHQQSSPYLEPYTELIQNVQQRPSTIDQASAFPKYLRRDFG